MGCINSTLFIFALKPLGALLHFVWDSFYFNNSSSNFRLLFAFLAGNVLP